MVDAAPIASGRDADVFPIDARRVLRRYRKGGDVAAEATVMRYVAGFGFPVPTVHQAHGTDLVMDRVDGPTMASALIDGTLAIPEAATQLADLHHRLHELPPRLSRDPAARVLHMDLHPQNVLLSSRGPVVIDWRNTTEGPADLDVALSAVILAQVAVDPTHAWAVPAKALLAAFLRHVHGSPLRVLDQAVAIRRADPGLTPEEVDLLDEATALVTGYASDMLRPWVLHVDLDQFIAAVEVLRRPELAGVPLIVGGRGDPTERAVVSTASYEARAFGVGSGMSLRLAARKAPSAVILPVDAAAYEAASAHIMAVLRAMDGAVVEVLGWDEAFVGVRTGDPEAFARRVQAEVLAATRLHCSVGIGDNKVRAKIATGFGKPRGMFRLTAANWFEVMGHRRTIALWGVGPRIAARLAQHGIGTVAELADADLAVLVGEFGPRMGTWYAGLGRGHGSAVVDDTPWVARGHSRERTFQRDLTEAGQVDEAIRQLVGEVLADVAREGRPAMRLTLKVRYAPFFTKTFSRTLPEPTIDAAVILAEALALLAKRQAGRPIRLLGLRAEMTMPEPDPAEHAS